MSTPGGEDILGNLTGIFKGRRERTGHMEVTRALPAVPPYLQAN